MKSLKLISSAIAMLICFVSMAQEKAVSKDTIHDTKVSSNTRIVICAPSRSAANEPVTILNGKVINSKQFSKINPNDIESIKILKGDEAKLIYGDKGVNGVIIITLKK